MAHVDDERDIASPFQTHCFGSDSPCHQLGPGSLGAPFHGSMTESRYRKGRTWLRPRFDRTTGVMT